MKIKKTENSIEEGLRSFIAFSIVILMTVFLCHLMDPTPTQIEIFLLIMATIFLTININFTIAFVIASFLIERNHVDLAIYGLLVGAAIVDLSAFLFIVLKPKSRKQISHH